MLVFWRCANKIQHNGLKIACIRIMTVLGKLEHLYEHLREKDYLPPVVYELGKAWCQDVRSVL